MILDRAVGLMESIPNDSPILFSGKVPYHRGLQPALEEGFLDLHHQVSFLGGAVPQAVLALVLVLPPAQEVAIPR